jgi:N-succinyl-L-ornithine transcarbamylase
VSLESATLHPLQSLTDVITITEALNERAGAAGGGGKSAGSGSFTLSGNENSSLGSSLIGGRPPKIVLTWAPHVKALPQCVPNSFAQWINAWGQAEFVITHPEDYELDEQFTRGARITHHQDEALKDADFVYVKNWSTYKDYGKIYCNDPEWMLTDEKLKLTRNARVMHCLPVRRNVELSDEVLDGSASIVTQEASNRVWAAQAVLAELFRQGAK